SQRVEEPALGRTAPGTLAIGAEKNPSWRPLSTRGEMVQRYSTRSGSSSSSAQMAEARSQPCMANSNTRMPNRSLPLRSPAGCWTVRARAPLVGHLSNRQFGQMVLELLDYLTQSEGEEGSDD